MKKPWFLPDRYQHASFEGMKVENGQLVHVREQGKKRSGSILRVKRANSAHSGVHVELVDAANGRPVRDLKVKDTDGALTLTGWSFEGSLLKTLRIRPANPKEQSRVTKALRVLGLG